ncbi:peptidylprolyl isomerase [Thioalkalivibrio nitratireducens]|uniref:peptidylprolyl isomerase n=1 Tax=Thioalkalivibrio nitratireducens TaxID=186931 RepID=UPI0005C20865|nr:peptidylprolyl isomerase [Thioalkalivibrio nitratireducens]
MTITVNGVEIPEQAIHREMQYHPAPSADVAQYEAARALVIRELLLQEARRSELSPPLDATDPEESLIQALMARAVQVPKADNAACRRYYDTHRERFRSPVVHHVSHILLPAAPDDHEARREAIAGAEELLAEIGDDPGAFTAAAMTHSACPSRDAGGDLGPIGRGQTVPEFEKALERMEPGKIASRPLETRYGVHLVYLRGREGGEQLPFEAVQAQVAEYMEQHVLRRAVAQYLQRLVGDARIDGLDLDGADTPLVQ